MTEAILAQPVPALLDASVGHYPHAAALNFMGRRWSYAALQQDVARATKGLQELGVKAGTRVALCLPNTPYSVIYFFAALRAGGIVVNLNPLYVERELAHLIIDSGAEFIVTIDLKVIYPKIAALAARTRLNAIIVCSMAGALPFPTNHLFSLTKASDLAPLADDGISYPSARLMHNDGKPTPVPLHASDVAVLQYTGGTTGVPKAAMLTHGNLTCNAAQCVLGLGSRPFATDRILGVLPLFHVFAMTTVMLVGVHSAAEIILLPRFELKAVLKTIARTRPTMLPAVPTIYTALIDAAAKQKVQLTSIELCVSGGAPLPLETRTRFMALTGCWLMEGYGLSETSPVVCLTPPGMPYKEGSVGVAVEGTVIEIRDLDNPTRLVAQGERGEVCIRGPQVMQAYWNRADETETTLVGGALRTGDVGYLDPDNYLFLVDRIKDIIIAGGYNIYPRVLEEALYQHPDVTGAVVIGVPDPYRGQAPKAFVTLCPGATTTPEALKAHMATYVSKIEMPREIEIRAELPKTLIGKLSKKELAAEEAARHPPPPEG